MSYLVITGRQSALSLAELESRYGAGALKPFSREAALLDIDQPPDIHQLGGSLKIATVRGQINSTNWQAISTKLDKFIPDEQLSQINGKLKLGISVYGLPISSGKINAAALTLKKSLRSSGRAPSVRIIPNPSADLNTAQVLYNKLTSENGIELLVVSDGQRTVVAQTIAVQDVDAYAARDQARPHRDSRVGMLPPKLAQIIINLAVGQNTNQELTVLDPFCGTGVILQEAILMGYATYGTDLEPRMVEFTQKNLDWLLKDHNAKLTVADATSHTWPHNSNLAAHSSPLVIACETYLGRALSSQPDSETLRKIINDCDTIHKKFLTNVARQTTPGFRMCIAVPAWRADNTFIHLKTLDHLDELGYNRISFVHSDTNDLVYHRKDQFVGRELVVLVRK